jgi:ATP-dependent Zn protease
VSARMTPEDALKRRCAAYHEAGHVVIVVHYNLPLMLASIVPGDAEHTLHHSPLRLLKEYRSSPMRARLAAEKGFHVCLAGAEAVRLIAPDRAGDGVENNHHEAAGFLIMLAEHEDERDAYNDLLCIQLKYLIASYRPAIDAIAVALLERGTLSGRDVRQIIRGTRSVRPRPLRRLR